MTSNRQKLVFSILLFIIFITVTIDVWQDWGEGSNLKHLVAEVIICLTVLMGLVALWSKNLFLKNELLIIHQALDKSIAEAKQWKEENAQLIEGLSKAIDMQLENWRLTPSEKDVALMLLKGLSLKEIAEIRTVSERTVRQQSIVIYQKSGLAGRAELSAFFLEDLLK